jgi:hypothetical protein
MTSRYTVDYGAAFAIAISMMVFFVMCRLQSRRMQTIFLLLVVGGWAVDIALKRNQHADYEYPTVEPYDYVGSNAAAITDESLQLPANGLAEVGEAGSRIPFDRVGWNQTNGVLGPLFVIFVKDPDFLELEISVNPDVHWSSSPKDFRAKIGLEQLRMDFVEETEAGWTIRFRGPQEKRYQAGLQTVFVATVPKEQIAEEATPWLMKSARWRSAGGEFQ